MNSSTSDKPDHNISRWPTTEMESAIRKFEEHGDYQDCLRLLGVEPDRSPMLRLQDALRRSTTRRDRDAFEDIAFHLSQGSDKNPLTAPQLDRILRRVTELYGPYGDRFLPAERIQALASGLWRLCTPPPSEECLLAVIGIEIQAAVNDTVAVSREEFGEALTISKTNCDRCGGSKGGRGNILCSSCLAKARVDLQHGFLTGRFSLEGGGKPDIDSLTPEFLRRERSRYGCAQCGHQPVKPCSCTRELTIPAQPKDGEVIPGREVATGKEHFFCLRLREN